MGLLSKLENLIRDIDSSFSPQEDLEQSVAEISSLGEDGANALAALIEELALCRSDKIGYALYAARHVQKTKRLVEVITSVLSEASSNRKVPLETTRRFQPELVGGGPTVLVGAWTDGTASRIKQMAEKALEPVS